MSDDTKALVERAREVAGYKYQHHTIHVPVVLNLLADTIERLERDAERYRWLRQNPTYMGWEHDFEPERIDRLVDEEMAEKEGK